MKRKILYILIAVVTFLSCEEIYHPELNVNEDYLVVEAVLYDDNPNNYIYLYKSREFGNLSSTFKWISGAKVFLINELGTKTQAWPNGAGNYRLEHELEKNHSYYLSIDIEGETYISSVQTIKEPPEIDSIYGQYIDKIYSEGSTNTTDNITTKRGIQLFVDISYQGNPEYYRFKGKKILQYLDYYEIPTGMGGSYIYPIYTWYSYYPTGSFNIAAPAEFSSSKDINKHQLEFFIEDYNDLISHDQTFKGWIYIIDQYRLDKEIYDYYKSSKKQLDAEGKIFDPVYIQAEGNISCTSNPDLKVLGNFEISSHKEYRYYLLYDKNEESFNLKKIPYFYTIPESGNIKDTPPEFWESLDKIYPDE
ncbi:MAG: DUF4249 domain-containing protein [Prolixibacteraceae bacterium]|nr:DUF4249 domain-containing protein [Prolixibacteraceae bacterium]